MTNTTQTDVQISQVAVSGDSFTVGTGSTTPITVAAGSAYQFAVQFGPRAAGVATGAVTIRSNAGGNGTAVISLSGTGETAAGALASLTCDQKTLTGAGTLNCEVSLSAAAGAGGVQVNLASSSSALRVPAAVTVPSGATGATFTATAFSVSVAQAVTVSSTEGGSTLNDVVQLMPLAQSAALSVGTDVLSFGNVAINSSARQSVTLTSTGTAPVTITAAAITGSGFSLSGLAFPQVLNPGKTATLIVNFNPSITGPAAGSITLASNAASGGTAVIRLSGSGQSAAAALNGLSCSTNSFSGAGQLQCEVSLSGAAQAGGQVVTLTSTSSAISLPAAITVPAGTTGTSFTAPVAAVATSQTAKLTAAAGNAVRDYTVTLSPATRMLQVSTNSLSFGDVTPHQAATRLVTISSTGTAPVTVSAGAVTGSGFAISGLRFPLTLNPGQSASLDVQFDPATAGAAAGAVVLTSNATAGGLTTTISLNGTGTATVGVLSGLSCSNGAISGGGTLTCQVSLSAAASGTGQSVALASSSSALQIPAAVTIPAGATTASFTAAAASVSAPQTVTLTSTAGGSTRTFAVNLQPGTRVISTGASSLAFGDVPLHQTVTRSVNVTSSGTAALTISAGTVTGAGFAISGLNFPLTLNPGQSATLSVQFDPSVAGTASGAIALTSDANSGATTTITLSGNGQATAGALSGLTCSSTSVTAAGNLACQVTLSAAAPSGGQAIALASSSSSVAVPASVNVAAGATTAAFTAKIASVTTSATVTLSATAAGTTKTFALHVGPGSAALTLQSTSISFGNITIGSPSTQSVTLTSSGTAPLTISAAAVTGTGFTISGLNLPLTLNPGQTASLNVEFNPAATGAASGAVTLSTNASSGGTTTIGLSGTGQNATYAVDLSWTAPSGTTDTVTGYNIYRAASGSSSYQLLNSSPNAGTTYTDTAVTSGSSYTYYVKSVDGSGVESTASNVYSATIP